MAKKPTPKTMTFADYARHQNVSYQTVRRWSDAGKIKRAAAGLIDVDRSDEMLVEARGDDVGKPGRSREPGPADEKAPFSSSEASRMKENYVALHKKLEFEREAGELAPIEAVCDAFAEEAAIIRTKNLELPAVLATQMVMIPTAEQAQAILLAGVTKFLNEMTLDARQTLERLLSDRHPRPRP